MGTVRGVCAILPDWHSVTFRHHTKLEMEALLIENCCKEGSEYSGILIFKNSNSDVTFLRNAKTAISSKKSDEKENNSKNNEKESNGNVRKNKASYCDDHAR